MTNPDMKQPILREVKSIELDVDGKTLRSYVPEDLAAMGTHMSRPYEFAKMLEQNSPLAMELLMLQPPETRTNILLAPKAALTALEYDSSRTPSRLILEQPLAARQNLLKDSAVFSRIIRRLPNTNTIPHRDEPGENSSIYVTSKFFFIKLGELPADALTNILTSSDMTIGGRKTKFGQMLDSEAWQNEAFNLLARLPLNNQCEVLTTPAVLEDIFKKTQRTRQGDKSSKVTASAFLDAIKRQKPDTQMDIFSLPRIIPMLCENELSTQVAATLTKMPTNSQLYLLSDPDISQSLAKCLEPATLKKLIEAQSEPDQAAYLQPLSSAWNAHVQEAVRQMQPALGIDARPAQPHRPTKGWNL